VTLQADNGCYRPILLQEQITMTYFIVPHIQTGNSRATSISWFLRNFSALQSRSLKGLAVYYSRSTLFFKKPKHIIP